MSDLIDRQEVIKALCERRCGDKPKGCPSGFCTESLAVDCIPSAQPNVPDRNVGEWEMFELITSTWYGKQCYFVEENGIVYSRVSCKYMSVDEAIKEFLGRIGDNG